MAKKPARVQYAVLPLRGEGDATEILMVTSRETKRWVIPKGWPQKKLAPHEAAAREAWEEAGVTGTVGTTPIGEFKYEKRLRSGKTRLCRVLVFLMRVDHEHDYWPEKRQRERTWFKPAAAALAVQESGLTKLLLEIAAPPPS
ncbi:MAG: NUDIX hydrolase [Alphaproteobacteria bacterium]|nr:NUDIX hydrolase [Alphaproteobacteria bacterium]MBF0391982.1 NUDIX hydrolase [Alphaproteobacteria bacterium]